MTFLLLLIAILLYYKFNYKLGHSLKIVLKIAFGLLLAYYILLGLYAGLGFLTSIFILILIGIFYYFTYLKYDKIKELEIKEWLNKPVNNINSMDFINILDANCNTKDILYKGENIPYNRVQYFLADENINMDLEDTHTIYYNAKAIKDNMSFKEEGYVVTNKGIIVKYLGVQTKRDDEPLIESCNLPFENLYKVNIDSKFIVTAYYADKTEKTLKKLSDSDRQLIYDILKYSIDSSWSRLVATEEKDVIDSSQIEALEKAVDTTNKNISIKEKNKIFVNFMTSINQLDNLKILNESQLNDRFSGAQGHGHVGEQAGNTFDRLKFKQVEALGGSHVKNGADRRVNGVNIQTKYCSTAGKSIGQCFDGLNAKYINPDGTMMKIEVPKDQYTEAVKGMRKAINEGKVPNETNPDNAIKYVEKGALTYKQSQIATKSIFDRNSTITIDGKVQKVTFLEKAIYSAGLDFATGVSVALPSSIVSGVWIFCTNRWQGVDTETAIKNSVKASVKSVLVSGTVFMVSSQFSRSKLAESMFNGMGIKLTSAGKAKLATGTMLGISVAITVGPDVVDALRGRISVNQLVKNTATTGGGMATGALVGSAFAGPIGAAVGATIGGTIGSFVIRKTLDNFIEDDAVEMIRIAKEEFIDEVIMNGLSTEEFEDVLKRTFLHKNFNVMLKKMYASGEPRRFIKEIFSNEVLECYNNRELPTTEEIIDVIVTNKVLTEM